MEDWNKLTVNQLKSECTNRGLDTTGKKADLVQRLAEYVAENEENGEEEMEQLEEEEEQVDEGDEVAEGDEEAEEVEAEEEEGGEEEAAAGEDEEAAAGEDDDAAAEEEAGEEGDAQDGEEEQAAGAENVDDVIDAIDSVMEEEGKKKEGENEEEKEKADEKSKLKKAASRPKIPTRKIVRTEFQEEQRVRTVVFGPLALSDLRNEEMGEFLAQADQFFIRFTTDGSSGHAQLRMKTFEDAQGLVEAMTENPFKEGLVIKQLGPEDGQNVDAILKGEPEKVQEKFDVRLLYVHNVPESATEDALKQLLPEALSACIPRDEKRKSKGYAYLEFEDSEKMEACYKTVDTLTLDGYLMTLHHIPQHEHPKYSTPNRPPMNRPSNFGNRGGRRPDGRGSYQNRDRRPDNRHQGGRQGYGGGGGNRNWGGNVRPLLGNQPSNWGNQGNQGGSGGVDAVNLLVGLSQMLRNQQGGGGQGNQNFGGGNQGFRQGGYGNRQGGSQDQWNRKRRANDGGMGYGKMQRRDNYGGGGGYNQGRRY